MFDSVDGAYTQSVRTAKPGLIMILLDQSDSMNDPYDRQMSKAQVAADVVNRVIHNVRLVNQKGTRFADRCYIGVIGYGAAVEAVVGGYLSELTEKILADPPADDLSRPPVWVEPVANNGTPMDRALDRARQMAVEWARSNRDSFPPVVLNITDGKPNDLQRRGDGKQTYAAAERLVQVGTQDGKLLLFNAHIADTGGAEILFPEDVNRLSDTYARYLFAMSSLVPPTLVRAAVAAGFSPGTGARGLVYNAGAEVLAKMLDFSSSPYR